MTWPPATPSCSLPSCPRWCCPREGRWDCWSPRYPRPARRDDVSSLGPQEKKTKREIRGCRLCFLSLSFLEGWSQVAACPGAEDQQRPECLAVLPHAALVLS